MRACVNSKVIEFRYGDLNILFEDSHKEAAIPQAVPVTRAVQQAQQQVDINTIETLEGIIKEDQLEQMMIEDPLEYERALLSRELEDIDGKEPGRTE